MSTQPKANFLFFYRGETLHFGLKKICMHVLDLYVKKYILGNWKTEWMLVKRNWEVHPYDSLRNHAKPRHAFSASGKWHCMSFVYIPVHQTFSPACTPSVAHVFFHKKNSTWGCSVEKGKRHAEIIMHTTKRRTLTTIRTPAYSMQGLDYSAMLTLLL